MRKSCLNRKKNEKHRYLSKGVVVIASIIEWIKTGNQSLPEEDVQKKNIKKTAYQWTADISNLVEIAYAILEAECINNGDAEIMAFVDFLGDTFNIQINRCSDFYYKMRTKSGSRTAFLHKLIKVLEARMDRDDEKNFRK
jgi:hypothetical protein